MTGWVSRDACDPVLDSDQDGEISEKEFISGFDNFRRFVQTTSAEDATASSTEIFAKAIKQLQASLVRNTSGLPRTKSTFSETTDGAPSQLWRTRTGTTLDLPVVGVGDAEDQEQRPAEVASSSVLLLAFKAIAYMGKQTSDSSALARELADSIGEDAMEMFEAIFEGCGEVVAVEMWSAGVAPTRPPCGRALPPSWAGNEHGHASLAYARRSRGQ